MESKIILLLVRSSDKLDEGNGLEQEVAEPGQNRLQEELNDDDSYYGYTDWVDSSASGEGKDNGDNCERPLMQSEEICDWATKNRCSRNTVSDPTSDKSHIDVTSATSRTRTYKEFFSTLRKPRTRLTLKFALKGKMNLRMQNTIMIFPKNL